MIIYTLHVALTDHGWSRQDDGSLDVVWDIPSNIERAKQRVKSVLHGCKML